MNVNIFGHGDMSTEIICQNMANGLVARVGGSAVLRLVGRTVNTRPSGSTTTMFDQ
jgi:hypothetical protein